jgi:outer membrane murein-binding lipoprotein Lpp
MTEDQKNRHRRRKEDLVKPLAGIILALLLVIGIGAYTIVEIATEANTAARDAKTLAAKLARTTATIEQLRAETRAREAEGRERRDQQCELFERQHLDDVKQLRGTYKYLLRLPPSELRAPTNPLNEAVILQLRETERAATRDSAPDFCDEPGADAERRGAEPVGLPEPDPKVPRRPAALKGIGAR